MANPEHLEILKQGVEAWNKWRKENPKVRPNLEGAELGGENLLGVDFKVTDLTEANLIAAFLALADLMEANLTGTMLAGARLMGANLTGAILKSANLKHAHLAYTPMGRIDLSQTKGIESVNHYAESTIGTNTLERTAEGLSKNPDNQEAVETFLRGAGVAEHMITYFRSMIGKPVEFYSCFISYSHDDKAFARRLYDSFQVRGIRCWLDDHEIEAGEPIMKAIDRGIRLWDKVLLCCSKASLTSWWVKDEIKKAIWKERELGKERGKEVYSLIPLNLDGYLLSDGYRSEFDSVLKERLAPDFVEWESDAAKYERELERVVRALRTDKGHVEEPKPKL